jgi:hypothetical protein
MNVILAGTIFAVVLSAGILALLEIGRHLVVEASESMTSGGSVSAGKMGQRKMLRL